MTKVFQNYLREGRNKTVSHSENIFPLPVGRKLSTAFNAAAASTPTENLEVLCSDGLAPCPISRDRFSGDRRRKATGAPWAGCGSETLPCWQLSPAPVVSAFARALTFLSLVRFGGADVLLLSRLGKNGGCFSLFLLPFWASLDTRNENGLSGRRRRSRSRWSGLQHFLTPAGEIAPTNQCSH